MFVPPFHPPLAVPRFYSGRRMAFRPARRRLCQDFVIAFVIGLAPLARRGVLAVALLLAPLPVSASGVAMGETAPVTPSQGSSIPSGLSMTTVAGPVAARVLRVVDGDTLHVVAAIWPGQMVETRVRLVGIDAPELRGRCEVERARAAAARDSLSGFVGDGLVFLHEIRFGKYAGRVLARVAGADGRDLSLAMIEAGLARPYEGGRRETWCTTQPEENAGVTSRILPAPLP